MRKTHLVAVGLGVLLALPAFGQQEDLKAKVDNLEQELKILKRQLELDKEVTVEKTKATAVVSAGASGFSIRSADTNFVLKVRGYVQADARFYPHDASTGASNDSFLMRRVRPIFEGTVFEKFDFRLMLDFGSNNSVTAANNGLVQDAYVNARFQPWFQVQAGKFKEPVSLERLQSGSNLLFVERGWGSQLAPNRDVGFMVQGDLFDGALNYAVGAFNGVADGGSGDFETGDDDKDIAGRIFATPFKNTKNDALRGLGFGVAGTFGNQEGALRSFTSPGQQSIFSYGLPAAGATPAVTVVGDGNHWRIAPQGYYYVGSFGLFGEYVISHQSVRRGLVQGEFEHTGWTLAASYFLTGEENSFKAVTPKRTFNPGEGGWGAVEVAARVQGLDVDDSVFPAFASAATAASSATSFGVGVNWYLNRNVKLSLNYERTDIGGGTSPLLRRGEQAVLTRAQVSF